VCVSAEGEPRRAELGGQLAFHRVTTSMFASWREVRAQELRWSEAPPAGATSDWKGSLRDLGGAVYTLQAGAERPPGTHGIAQLEALAEVLGECGRGSRREWARLALLHRDRADRAWRRANDVLERANPRTHTRLVRALEHMEVQSETGFAAGSGGDRHEQTPVLDALVWRALAGGSPKLWRNQ
jgi:hypothetical protein